MTTTEAAHVLHGFVRVGHHEINRSLLRRHDDREGRDGSCRLVLKFAGEIVMRAEGAEIERFARAPGTPIRRGRRGGGPAARGDRIRKGRSK
jgi:hypothetical protein